MYRSLLVLLVSVFLSCPAWGQEERKIPISFLPPPLETATFSLGIYDAKSGRLVRRLQEAATQDAFTVGLNGLITSWDGKDDGGKSVPPGHYAARGYAVGALKVEGENILGNDWTSDDENLRLVHVDAINLLPGGELIVLAEMADGVPRVICFDRAGENIRWISKLIPYSGKAAKGYSVSTNDEFVSAVTPTHQGIFRVSDGQIFQGLFDQMMRPSGTDSGGKDRTRWKIEAGVLNQYALHGEKLRQLTAKPGEPAFIGVAASETDDRLYLLEEALGWQRVRGLSWIEAKEEDGKAVSNWQTFFEHGIRPLDPTSGLDDPTVLVEVSLVENPLDPGRPQKIKLLAKTDEAGSYLESADRLRLRRISQRANLKTAKVVKGKATGTLTFFQSDDAAWDEFSIEGVKNMMAFDAGEIEMTADGEKTHPEKAAEPPDL